MIRIRIQNKRFLHFSFFVIYLHCFLQLVTACLFTADKWFCFSFAAMLYCFAQHSTLYFIFLVFTRGNITDRFPPEIWMGLFPSHTAVSHSTGSVLFSHGSFPHKKACAPLPGLPPEPPFCRGCCPHLHS